MKTLITYFTYTGHTKGIAEFLKAQTSGELFEIRPADKYSDDYDTTERQGRKETRDGYRPALAENIDLSAYDKILIGSPNWFNTVAPPVATFLAENDFSGKNLYLFCTNGGGGLGHTVSDIKSLAKNGNLIDSVNIYEDGARDKNKIIDWLKKNGLTN